jgi:hypothetical protein
MSNLRYQLQGLMLRNKDGSFSTQQARKDILLMLSSQLKEGGYKLETPHSLKPKHVEYLVSRWQSEQLSAGTIKNRMTHIRWWAEKIGKASMLPKSNNGANHAISLDIEKRCYIPEQSKAKELDLDKAASISDRYIQLSLRLQQEFGLRREEAIKFRPAFADRGDTLVMKPSWTKGGRPREIPIRNQEQRSLLNEIHQLVGNGSLIPHQKNYVQQLKSYERNTCAVGLDRNHGLRHLYAQQRYHELTGWPAPLAGGPLSNQLTPTEKALDKEARLIVSAELGHCREQITATYLGR